MNLKAIGDKIIVIPAKTEDITSFGMVIPANADMGQKIEGTVVAVGPKAIGVKVGDTVLFRAWGGDNLERGGEKYKVLKADDTGGDILAVIVE